MSDSLWQNLQTLIPLSASDRDVADGLIAQYQQLGYLPRTCREMLMLPDGVMVRFYAQLATERTSHSSVQAYDNSGWMAQSDFCFINVRATGIGKDFGTFIQATKLLPVIRADALHLGPFTQYGHGVIYIVESVITIAPQVVDPRLATQGVGAEAQLHAFVQAAHMLGKTVGFDLEPHTAQFAIPVLMHPELFRWIKLYAPDKRWLDYYFSNDTVLQLEQQQRLVAEVRAIVTQALRESGLSDLEAEAGDNAARLAYKRETFHRIIKTLIDRGYWTIPTQIWSGAGVPAFARYNFEGHYPEFCTLSRAGEDMSAEAYSALTPFAFYHHLPVNRAPDLNTPPERNEAAWTYFCEIFARWRDEFGFDFIRHDSVDHIFDSTLPGHSEWPDADRPTPALLAACIAASKSSANHNCAYIGNLAERMGNEIEDYAALGYDLMLGSDMLERVDRANIEKSFAIHERLIAVNQQRATPFSVVYAIDTHDTGNPFIWGEPLLKRMGPRRMRLRYFVARFISCGLARRPKNEVMGAQDMSYGLYHANVTESNLTWVGDVPFNQFYHQLEDIYAEYRAFLASATLVRREVGDTYAWWVMQNDTRWLIPVITLEQGEAETAPAVSLDIPIPSKVTHIHCYDFASSMPVLLTPQDDILPVRDLPYLDFRLFEIGV